MDLIILLLAAGLSERFKKESKSAIKQLEVINEKTVLEICLINILNLDLNAKILTVASKETFLKTKLICKNLNILPPIIGGTTRQESVRKGLDSLKKINPHAIIVHDVARPIINKLVVNNLICNLKDNISCVVPYLKVSDSLAKVKINKNLERVNKSEYYLIQTPQICVYNDLKKAHSNIKDNELFDDESSLLSEKGFKIKTIQGDPKSLKITYKSDFELVKNILNNDMKNYITKTGIGYDVHRLMKKNNTSNPIKKLILGGLVLDNEYYLEGHSDADVLLHSITDSIYGSINEQDIGYHFPPNDVKWKNCNSFLFLNHALEKLKKKGGIITSIDSVIITETPKILDIVEQMKDKIAMNTKIKREVISIKGKTNEGIGFIGRKEGIAVFTNTTILVPNKNE